MWVFGQNATKKSQIDKGHAKKNRCIALLDHTGRSLRPLGVALAPAEVELRRPGASGALPQASPVATRRIEN